MSSPRLPAKSGKLEFSGRLPKFLSGPPITFTDTANDNFMRFFFNLLSSSSHNAHLFKKTVGDIAKHAEQSDMCYCDVKTTPVSEPSYKTQLLRSRLREYLQQLELNRKQLAMFVSKNVGMMVLLALMSRSLMGTSFPEAKNYTEGIDDVKTFKFLGGKFGYRLEQVDSMFQFTGKVADFGLHIAFQMLAGNHSDVVEVLKFRPQSPLGAPDPFDEEAESIQVDTVFEPPQEKKSGWDKVRKAFGPKHQGPKLPVKHDAPQLSSSPFRKPSGKQAEQSTGVKEERDPNYLHEAQAEKRFDYLNAHQRPLKRQKEYEARYPMPKVQESS